MLGANKTTKVDLTWQCTVTWILYGVLWRWYIMVYRNTKRKFMCQRLYDLSHPACTVNNRVWRNPYRLLQHFFGNHRDISHWGLTVCNCRDISNETALCVILDIYSVHSRKIVPSLSPEILTLPHSPHHPNRSMHLSCWHLRIRWVVAKRCNFWTRNHEDGVLSWVSFAHAPTVPGVAGYSTQQAAPTLGQQLVCLQRPLQSPVSMGTFSPVLWLPRCVCVCIGEGGGLLSLS